MHRLIQKCFSAFSIKNRGVVFCFFLFGHFETSCSLLARKLIFQDFLGAYCHLVALKKMASCIVCLVFGSGQCLCETPDTVFNC